MNTQKLIHLGVPLGEATRQVTDFVFWLILAGDDNLRLQEEVSAIVANPTAFMDHPLRGEFAKASLN